MMNSIKPVNKKIPELKDYFEYYFEDKDTLIYGNYSMDSQRKGDDLVWEEEFYPT